ncbi:hypothetical protein KUV80_07940 [Fictibacillus nanhaiensis]|uniref:hypothetical protein n=1 Tax=Fictibacillus nanhaiensis TaxID=742169 RepID=UPI001C96ECF9|nr:hypothetical protein [Fictibacillus nanhaiensis]MBY6036579.1 hypothetical protein [Fictibacillus nanhaiensis]
MDLFQTGLFWLLTIAPIVLFIVAIARTSWVLMIVNLLLTLPLVGFVSWIADRYGAVLVVIAIHLVLALWLWVKRQRMY